MDTKSMRDSAIDAEKERILNYLASVPDYGATSCTTAVLRAIMLHTSGRMMAQGYMYTVTTKNLGAGVYRIWLENGQAFSLESAS